MTNTEDINFIKEMVANKFAELKSALVMREKLLLRQLDVINSTNKQHLIALIKPKDREQLLAPSLSSTSKAANLFENESNADIQFVCDNEEELLAAIRNFGRYHLVNINLSLQDVYLQNEDYIEPIDDHETMFKDINGIQTTDYNYNDRDDEGHPIESLVVDFSRQRSLMEHNAKMMNESIINITLKEAKELIKQTTTATVSSPTASTTAILQHQTPVPPLNLEELNDEVESSIAEVVSGMAGAGSLSEFSEMNSNNNHNNNNKSSQTQQQALKLKRSKSKVTINNCNGTINLRNIASLTINCATEDNIQAQLPLHTHHQDGENLEDDLGDSSASNNTLINHTCQKCKTLVESLVSSTSNTEGNTPLPPIAPPIPPSQPPEATSATTTTTTNTTASSHNTTSVNTSNYSSNNSSRSQSRKQKSHKKSLKIDKSYCSNNNNNHNTRKSLDLQEGKDVDTNNADTSSNDSVTCDFYNRLLNEIKRTIKQNHKIRNKCTSSLLQAVDATTNTINIRSNSNSNSNSNSDSNSNCNTNLNYKTIHNITGSSNNNNNNNNNNSNLNNNHSNTKTNLPHKGKRMVLKNFDNLRIILEAYNSGDEEVFHPIQIEQWLQEIVANADLEPVQNTDILEHSKIHNEFHEI